ncbi:hypothetical protein RRG08_002948 [Elysia crispata]|uniref:Uncharacterized protein n=1 Tax=Elysia crispata TaxID=231223 RepID=A0AAE1E3K6_9GAST|nr:hypothetical protein RRG08_002948 [Elysia crispata]
MNCVTSANSVVPAASEISEHSTSGSAVYVARGMGLTMSAEYLEWRRIDFRSRPGYTPAAGSVSRAFVDRAERRGGPQTAEKSVGEGSGVLSFLSASCG